jgi:hypothetical protein
MEKIKKGEQEQQPYISDKLWKNLKFCCSKHRVKYGAHTINPESESLSVPN